MSEEEIRQLNGLLGANVRSNEMTIDEVISVLTQITLALLIVFVMANVLFIGRAKAEVKFARQKVIDMGIKIKNLDPSTVEQYEGKRDALIELQRQRLLLALERIEAADRDVYGPGVFTTIDGEGKKAYIMDNVLSSGDVVNEMFKQACITAKNDLPSLEAKKENWRKRTLLLAGMRLRGAVTEDVVVDNPEIVSSSNAVWLMREIDAKLDSLYADCCDMQKKAIAYLQKHYQNNTEVLNGTEVYSLVRKFLDAAPEDRNSLIEQIRDKLYEHSKSVFEKSGVPLLNEV